VKEQATIEAIFNLRVRNNDPWKRLMQIALKHAPEETKAVLREISGNDAAITTLMQELVR
jgi:hypothetical protein